MEVSNYRGLWRRTCEEEPIGRPVDRLSRVYWMQGSCLFTDLRVPPAHPFDAGREGWAALATPQLVHLARTVRGFAGEASVAPGMMATAGAIMDDDGGGATITDADAPDPRPRFTWDRRIDFRPFDCPDVGRMTLEDGGALLIEDGDDLSYREFWERVDGGAEVTTLRLVSERRECCGAGAASPCGGDAHARAGYMIFTGRTHVAVVIDRREQLPPACKTIDEFLRTAGWDGQPYAAPVDIADAIPDAATASAIADAAAASAASASSATASSATASSATVTSSTPATTTDAEPAQQQLRRAAAQVLSFHCHLASCVIRRGAMDGVRMVATTSPHLDFQRRVLGPRLAASGRYAVDESARRVTETLGMGIDGLADEVGAAATTAPGPARAVHDPFGDGSLLPGEPAVLSREWEIVDWDYNPF
jgi:hypothetical protein